MRLPPLKKHKKRRRPNRRPPPRPRRANAAPSGQFRSRRRRRHGQSRSDPGAAPSRRRSLGPQSAGRRRGTAETAAIEDRLRALARANIARNNCWRAPLDLPEPGNSCCRCAIGSEPERKPIGQPRVISRAITRSTPTCARLLKSALRAVRQCDPFPFAEDPVVGNRYDIWRANGIQVRAETIMKCDE